VNVIKCGGIIAYPTEAVFGFGCDPYNYQAVQRIINLKGRSMSKGVILIAADFAQLTEFITELSVEKIYEIRASWPGFVTWIVPAKTTAPHWITGGRATIAVRVTAHPVAAAVCCACNTALVSTSANYTGQAPARHLWQVRRNFKNNIDYLLPGTCNLATRPSKIIDAATGKVLRL
jgi:L-threonylcarbamoyladenylate synthase